MVSRTKGKLPFNGMVISKEIPFNGKVSLKDGKVFALMFQNVLTKKQYEYLVKWWEQYYPNIVRKYER